MKTIHSTLFNTRSSFDRELLTTDEFEQRTKLARDLMSKNGLGAMLIFSDTERYGALSYLSGYIPMSHWALLLVPFEGDPRLLIATFSRDLAFQKSLTVLQDVKAPGNIASEVKQWIAELKLEKQNQAIGVVNADTATLQAFNNIVEVCKPLHIIDFDLQFRNLMRSKRVRERVVIEKSTRILAEAIKELTLDSDYSKRSMINAILKAKDLGANEVRLTYSGADLVWRGIEHVNQIPHVVYLAVENCGYWSEGFMSRAGSFSSRAKSILDDLLSETEIGTTAKKLNELVIKKTSGMLLHGVVKDDIGHGLGLSTNEPPNLNNDNPEESIRDGDVCTFQVGFEGNEHSIVSAIAAFYDGKKQVLWSSPQ